MPTPIDGRKGPSIALSSFNFLLPVSGRSPLLSVVTNYLKNEGRLYNNQKFDLVINDGDVGSNAIAQRRNIKCIFITNQFRPRLWASRFYLFSEEIFLLVFDKFHHYLYNAFQHHFLSYPE